MCLYIHDFKSIYVLYFDDEHECAVAYSLCVDISLSLFFMGYTQAPKFFCPDSLHVVVAGAEAVHIMSLALIYFSKCQYQIKVASRFPFVECYY
jgi:hypothetical protein